MSVAQKDGIKAAEGISYEDLYQRWEQSNWSATAIDFTPDREGWAALTDLQRRSALWIYSMFFYGEDSVTDNLSPYIDAAPKEEQKYFLATQQVDEARHAVFFHRFFKEVIGAGDSIASTLAYTEAAAQLGLSQRLRPPRPDGRRPAPRPLAAELRPRDRALPHGRRGDPRAARPALHRGLLRRRRDDARVQRGDGERLARRAAPHRLRRQGAVRVLRRVGGVQGRRSPSCCARCCPTRSRCSSPSERAREYTRAYGFELEDLFAFGLARCGPSGGRPAIRSRTCPGCCRSTPSSRRRRSRGARSCCSRPA